MINIQGSRAQLNNTYLHNGDLIIFNKTSTSKPQLILNEKFSMKEIKSDRIVISEKEICYCLMFCCCQACDILVIFLSCCFFYSGYHCADE